MCGILAIIELAEKALQARMKAVELSRRLRHRGPDDSGLHLIVSQLNFNLVFI